MALCTTKRRSYSLSSLHADRYLSIQNNMYRYTEDLLAMEQISQGVGALATPVLECLPILEWSPYLRSHPDQRFAAFLHRGLTSGFRIGFNQASRLRSPPANFRSVTSNPHKVECYIALEVAAGRLLAAHPTTVRRNPIGLIPK